MDDCLHKASSVKPGRHLQKSGSPSSVLWNTSPPGDKTNRKMTIFSLGQVMNLAAGVIFHLKDFPVFMLN